MFRHISLCSSRIGYAMLFVKHTELGLNFIAQMVYDLFNYEKEKKDITAIDREKKTDEAVECFMGAYIF